MTAILTCTGFQFGAFVFQTEVALQHALHFLPFLKAHVKAKLISELKWLNYTSAQGKPFHSNSAVVKKTGILLQAIH